MTNEKRAGLRLAAGLVCRYCFYNRPVEPGPNGAGAFHRVARGGDQGGTEPCLAHGIHLLVDKMGQPPLTDPDPVIEIEPGTAPSVEAIRNRQGTARMGCGDIFAFAQGLEVALRTMIKAYDSAIELIHNGRTPPPDHPTQTLVARVREHLIPPA